MKQSLITAQTSYDLNVMDMAGTTTVLQVEPAFTVKHVKWQLAKTTGLDPMAIHLACAHQLEDNQDKHNDRVLLSDRAFPEADIYLLNNLTLQKCGLSRNNNNVFLVIVETRLDHYAEMCTCSKYQHGDNKHDKLVKVLVVGSAKCGKTSLIKRFIDKGKSAYDLCACFCEYAGCMRVD